MILITKTHLQSINWSDIMSVIIISNILTNTLRFY